MRFGIVHLCDTRSIEDGDAMPLTSVSSLSPSCPNKLEPNSSIWCCGWWFLMHDELGGEMCLSMLRADLVCTHVNLDVAKDYLGCCRRWLLLLQPVIWSRLFFSKCCKHKIFYVAIYSSRCCMKWFKMFQWASFDGHCMKHDAMLRREFYPWKVDNICESHSCACFFMLQRLISDVTIVTFQCYYNWAYNEKFAIGCSGAGRSVSIHWWEPPTIFLLSCFPLHPTCRHCPPFLQFPCWHRPPHLQLAAPPWNEEQLNQVQEEEMSPTAAPL